MVPLNFWTRKKKIIIKEKWIWVKKALHGTKRKNFFQNSPKSIYFHELSKINEMKNKTKTIFFIRIRIWPLFAQKHENQIFSVFAESSATICSFILHTFQMRFNSLLLLHKSTKTSFWAQFDPFCPQNGEIGFFLENRAPSLLSIYSPLTSCKKLEKTNEPMLRKVRYERTDERTDALTGMNL